MREQGDATKQRGRRTWSVAALMLLFALVGALVVGLRQPPKLMDRAKLVTSYRVPAGEMVFEHRWMPDGRIRVLVVPLRSFSRVEEVEPRTGDVVSRRVFNGVTNACWLSPDGKRLLSLEPGAPAGSISLCRIFSVDEGRQLTCVKAAIPKRTPGNQVVGIHILWNPNSREWMDMSTAGMGTVHRVQGGMTRSVAIRNTGLMVPLILDSRDRLLVHTFRSSRGGSLGYREISLSGPSGSRSVPLQLPAGVEMSHAYLSPDERRIAWYIRFREQQPGWLQRLMALVGRRPGADYKSEAVYVCDRNGANMRDLGRVVLSGAEGHISALQWTRDGAAVTFFQNKHLYAVDVAR